MSEKNNKQEDQLEIPSNILSIYDKLLKLKIDLDLESIPVPSYIQEKIIQCNEYQRRVERYFIEVTQFLSVKERMFRIEKLNIDMLRRQVLINNESIKKLPTGKEREAAVDEFLEDKYQELLKLENTVCALKDILSAVKTVQSNLKATNADIKVLVRVMEQQINRLNMGHPEDPEIKKLRKTFSELDAYEKSLEEDLEEEIDTEDVESLGCQESEDGSDDCGSSKVEPEPAQPESDEDEDLDLSAVESFLTEGGSETNNNLSDNLEGNTAEEEPVPEGTASVGNLVSSDSTDGESETNNNLSDSGGEEEEGGTQEKSEEIDSDDPLASFMMDDLDSDEEDSTSEEPRESGEDQKNSKGLFDDDGYLLEESEEKGSAEVHPESETDQDFSLDDLLNEGSKSSSEKKEEEKKEIPKKDLEPVGVDLGDLGIDLGSVEEGPVEEGSEDLGPKGEKSDTGPKGEKLEKPLEKKKNSSQSNSLDEDFFKDGDFDLDSILGDVG